LFGWIGKALKFLFKVAAIALFVVAMVLLPGAIAGFVAWNGWFILMGLAGAAGLAGWHNGKLGTIAGALLSAGLAWKGNARTPNTFPNGTGVGGVSNFLPAQAQAQQNTLSRGVFMTAQQAAVAALRAINRRSRRENAEYSGAVCQDSNGRIRYTRPRRFRQNDPVNNPNNFDPRNSSPLPVCPSGTLIGWYHTHAAWDQGIYQGPGLDGNEVFSQADLDISNNNGIPGWVATPTRRIYRYTPGQSYGVVDISRIYGRTP
jgi:hypothetical protein